MKTISTKSESQKAHGVLTNAVEGIFSFGAEEAEKYKDLIIEKLAGKTVSKSKALGEKPGGLVYEANALGIDMWDLLRALEGMCALGLAQEIDDSTYLVSRRNEVTGAEESIDYKVGDRLFVEQSPNYDIAGKIIDEVDGQYTIQLDNGKVETKPKGSKYLRPWKVGKATESDDGYMMTAGRQLILEEMAKDGWTEEEIAFYVHSDFDGYIDNNADVMVFYPFGNGTNEPGEMSGREKFIQNPEDYSKLMQGKKKKTAKESRVEGYYNMSQQDWQRAVDDEIQRFGRIGGGLLEELGSAGYYSDSVTNKVFKKVPDGFDERKRFDKQYVDDFNAKLRASDESVGSAKHPKRDWWITNATKIINDFGMFKIRAGKPKLSSHSGSQGFDLWSIPMEGSATYPDIQRSIVNQHASWFSSVVRSVIPGAKDESYWMANQRTATGSLALLVPRSISSVEGVGDESSEKQTFFVLAKETNEEGDPFLEYRYMNERAARDAYFDSEFPAVLVAKGKNNLYEIKAMPELGQEDRLIIEEQVNLLNHRGEAATEAAEDYFSEDDDVVVYFISAAGPTRKSFDSLSQAQDAVKGHESYVIYQYGFDLEEKFKNDAEARLLYRYIRKYHS